MLKKTPLNRIHRDLAARMVDFGGWDMPVQYTGVIDEHLATREAAGLFDVSHMGEVEVRGAGALAYIQHLTINDAARLEIGQVQYSAICYPHGGIVDDVTLYRFAADRFLFCVNASNADKDYAWMEQVLEEGDFPDVELRNLSDDYAQLALQGPAAETILARLTTHNLKDIRYYHFAEGQVAGVPTIISRTGYTGEDGFELYFAAEAAESVWTALMAAGSEEGIKPCGLGARDTLRLEMKFALYGHELSSEISPLEAGLGWITKFDKGDFIGRDALLKQKEKGVPRRLAGLVMTDRGIPRDGYPVFAGEEQVGTVTSGTMSPCLKVGIALALVRPECSGVGKELSIGIRNRQVACRVAKTPFIKNWRD
ncbi:glycine cleavage system aminomethyltransferase GcvT [Geothermobacter hydrogeniphilus]|uniref:Aminomethyltransferase n=1 Tax=Geothermobacter hydrogeniphilus TaxID=1969733 RepID=A0A1X0XSR3_9BACT|nr:glycine cleavage system aminomethyltransferase GcvT [Geothermobacter hydrogeniphilus]ORJ55914.1 glycine cleavage system protein T [Geothermobacter hydrogeniphilus]